MNVSINTGGNRQLIQIGDNSAGIFTSGYVGTWMHENLSGGAGGREQSSGFEFYQIEASYYGHGIAHLVLHDDGNTHYWVCTMVIGQKDSPHVVHGGGYRNITGGRSIDRVRFNVQSGQWDSGQATLSYSW